MSANSGPECHVQLDFDHIEPDLVHFLPVEQEQKTLTSYLPSTDMKRRAFFIGHVGVMSFLPGCIGNSLSGTEGSPTNSPTSNTSTHRSSETLASQQERKDACFGANGISFYALEGGEADTMWSPGTVRVAFHLGAGADVLLVVYEGNTVLGMDRVSTSSDVSIDGMKIPLDTKLSGKHTIRVVIYPATAESGQFNATEATQCQHKGTAIQTESTTINFSRFSEKQR